MATHYKTSTMIPEQIVKERWPEAYYSRNPITYVWTIWVSLYSSDFIARGQFESLTENTEQAAWENALKNLGDE